MATYMYPFTEIDYGDGLPPFSDVQQIFSLTEGSFNVHDYTLFDALAGGREDSLAPEDRDPARRPKFAPRGIPTPRSLAVSQCFLYLIDDPIDVSGAPDRHFWPADRCVDPDEADEWVKKGSVRTEVVQWFNGNRVWPAVSEPIFYNATWLWLSECDEAIKHHGLSLDALPVEYVIIREALRRIEERYGQQRARLVVWFS